MEALVVGALGAVVGGALAFGIWMLLPDVWQAARTPVAIVVAVLCGLSASRIELPVRQTPAEVESAMLADPDLGELMTAWKETDPSAFAGFVALAAEQGDADFTEARNDPRFLQMVTVAGRRLAYLSDEQAVERFRISRDQMLELRRTNPALCTSVFFNRGVDYSDPPFSRTLHRRFLALQANGLRSSPRTAPRAMTQAEVQTSAQEISQRLRAVVDEDIGLLSPDAIVAGNEARFCEVAAEYFNQVSLSPEPGRLNAGMVRMQHGSP